MIHTGRFMMVPYIGSEPLKKSMSAGRPHMFKFSSGFPMEIAFFIWGKQLKSLCSMDDSPHLWWFSIHLAVTAASPWIFPVTSDVWMLKSPQPSQRTHRHRGESHQDYLATLVLGLAGVSLEDSYLAGWFSFSWTMPWTWMLWEYPHDFGNQRM